MLKGKMFGLTLAVALVVCGIASASAFAVEAEFLSTGGFPNSIKEIKSGAGELTGGEVPVTCTSDEGGEAGGKGGQIEAGKKGKFDVLFLGCKALFVNCTGLSDTTTGSILVTGTVEPVYALEKGTTSDLDPAIVIKIDPVHFSCATKLIKVTGSLCVLIKPVNEPVPAGGHYTFEAKGKEAELKYSLEKGGSTLFTCELKIEENDTGTLKTGFEKTNEEVFLEKASELMA